MQSIDCLILSTTNTVSKVLKKSTKSLSPRERHLLARFGITGAQYDQLLRQQDLRCGVCKRLSSEFKHRLAVDHDHKTGEIRGLLCIHCNRWIVGRHRKDVGRDLLANAVIYLDNEYTGWVVPPKKKKKKYGRRKKTLRVPK